MPYAGDRQSDPACAAGGAPPGGHRAPAGAHDPGRGGRKGAPGSQGLYAAVHARHRSPLAQVRLYSSTLARFLPALLHPFGMRDMRSDVCGGADCGTVHVTKLPACAVSAGAEIPAPSFGSPEQALHRLLSCMPTAAAYCRSAVNVEPTRTESADEGPSCYAACDPFDVCLMRCAGFMAP